MFKKLFALNFNSSQVGPKENTSRSSAESLYKIYYKESPICEFEVYTSDIPYDPQLAYNLMTSERFILGVKISHPEPKYFLVPTDKFWRVFGEKDGDKIIQDVQESLAWHGDQNFTEQRIEDINQKIQNTLN